MATAASVLSPKRTVIRRSKRLHVSPGNAHAPTAHIG
jgi:hypothetical protein